MISHVWVNKCLLNFIYMPPNDMSAYKEKVDNEYMKILVKVLRQETAKKLNKNLNFQPFYDDRML